MKQDGSRALRWGWLLLAAGSLVAVWFLIFGAQVGTCVDYVSPATGQSSCTSGPAVGTAGALVLGIGGLVLAGYAVLRAFGVGARKSQSNHSAGVSS
jgi:hypothetical protein